MPDPLPVRAVDPSIDRPLDAEVRPPGSKSLTNRALVCAALASGRSRISGALLADDTLAMVDCLRDLGATVLVDGSGGEVIDVVGTGGDPGGDGALLDARMSGTTSRFVMPVAALGHATVVLDGAASLRARPMGDLIDALGSLGARIEPLGETGFLPVRIDGRGLEGGRVSVRGDASSQFLSGLLLAAPCMRAGLEVEVTTTLVSRPYVEMTAAVMRAFGAEVTGEDDQRHLTVASGGYTAVDDYVVEPDASAASYLFAAAALLGGRVRVLGLDSGSVQGDVRFVEVLERMGARVERGDGWTEVHGTGTLRGVDEDLSDISDTAQTLAVLAPFADGPTTLRGIGFIRGKETDRVGAVATELGRVGVRVDELDDGLRIHPGTPHGGVVRTYDDHRMAMSFGLLGLRTPGVSVADPGCVSKTFPDYWQVLGELLGRPVSDG